MGFSHPNQAPNPGSPLTSCVTLLFNHLGLTSLSVNGDDAYNRLSSPIVRIKWEQVCKGQINAPSLPLGCATSAFYKSGTRQLGQIPSLDFSPPLQVPCGKMCSPKYREMVAVRS